MVIVVGDTAMDCVRTALREKPKSVKCVYRRDEHSMPGSRKEYLNAKEEGVDFEFLATPKRVLKSVDSDEVVGVEFAKTELSKSSDKNGRRKLTEVKNGDFIFED